VVKKIHRHIFLFRLYFQVFLITLDCLFKITSDPDPAFHLNADPDPTFHLNADQEPDSVIYFNADPDPDPASPKVMRIRIRRNLDSVDKLPRPL
jgi:hypothetical protein